MSLSPRFLDEIRSRLSLSDIIGKRVKLTRAGREFKGCCPFHNEKTPSFTVNDQKQFYHCFGCGAHGDVIGFVMRHDNLGFPQAVEMLAADAGLEVPKPDPKMAAKAEKAKTLHSLMEDAARFMERALTQSSEGETALKYLIDRGMNQETLTRFRIGYAPEDGQVLRAHLKGQGFTDGQMIETGVLKASSRGTDPYGFFRGRIMFPVGDRRGRVVAFGGRILPDHLRPPDRGDFVPPKYINSPDTTLFDKGRTLYAGSLARQSVGGGKPLIVTEGYMDVIACHRAGFSGAVAPMGTALTEDQILMAWTMIPADYKAPILCFDGDTAGRRAAGRAAERVMPLIKPGHSVRIAFMPDGEDPDTLIRARGTKAFQTVLDSALSLFDFLWLSHTGTQPMETPEERTGAIQAIEKAISAIADRDVQSHYKAQLRQKVSDTFFRRNYGGTAKKYGQNHSYGSKNKKTTGRAGAFPAKLRKPVNKGAALRHAILLATLMNYPDLYEECDDFLGRLTIEDRRLDDMRQRLIMTFEEHDQIQTEELVMLMNKDGFEDEISRLLSQKIYIHAAFCVPGQETFHVRTTFKTWLDELKNHKIRKKIQAV